MYTFFYLLLIIALLIQTYRLYVVKDEFKVWQNSESRKDFTIAQHEKDLAKSRAKLNELYDQVASQEVLIRSYSTKEETAKATPPIPHPTPPVDISKKSFQRDAKGHFKK